MSGRKVEFDTRRFRNALGQYATGVTVITAQGLDGEPIGLTVNSFSSVSLDPPLVLWSIDLASESLPAFAMGAAFAVNILHADQEALARRFAGKGLDRFAGIDIEERADGVCILPGCIGWFVCRTVAIHRAGDHDIIIGQVTAFEALGGPALTFHSGQFGRTP